MAFGDTKNFYMISAKIIADSKNQFGDRITSFELVMPRIILAEFNTHRMFSRNSASSRAIPFKKMVEMVETNPFIPYKWMKDHKGMQGNEYIEDEQLLKELKDFWIFSSKESCKKATLLNKTGVTKQICNRLLEPFMWHKVICTATDYENFFALRNHPDVEIHMQELAKLMLLAYNASTPKELKDGEWHIPYGDDIDNVKLALLCSDSNYKYNLNEAKVMIATSRCAGVSYTVIGEDGEVENYEKLIKRHDNLSKSGHWSPFEHCAMAMGDTNENLYEDWGRIIKSGNGHKVEYGWCGNFKGFIQYRKMFTNENKTDSRVIKK